VGGQYSNDRQLNTNAINSYEHLMRSNYKESRLGTRGLVPDDGLRRRELTVMKLRDSK